MHLLAISGSLRSASANTVLLRALAHLTPEGIRIVLYEGLTTLPYFNPDLDTEPIPTAVRDFRAQLQAADGIVICSPEYAHGVPGVLKNALDWIVSSGELMHKPLALLNASPRATHAQASLTETLRVMMAQLIEAASPSLPVSGRKLTEMDIVNDPALADPLRTALQALVEAIRARP